MKPRLVVIGGLPPPLHGVTISTSLVLANPDLAEAFVVRHVDLSDGRDAQNIGRLDVQNVWIGLRSLLDLARQLRGPRGVVYLPLSQGLLAVLRDSLYVRLAAARGWKVAAHLRGSEFRGFYDAQSRVARWWIRGTLRRVSSMAVMGSRLHWIFAGLIAEERITVVVNGTPDLRLDTGERHGETGLYLSNLRRRKGVVEALEAAIMVLRERPTARFIFAGSPESPQLDRQMRDMAADFGDRIEFRGPVSGQSKSDVLAQAGYLLFPPAEPEGHPRVVLEALAAGLPVVTTDRGAIAETVIDGASGFVLDDPVPSQLAERILTLLGEPGLRDRMSRAARRRYESQYTQEHTDRQLARWLSDLAAQ